MPNKLQELTEYINRIDNDGQAWEEIYCLEAIEILKEFTANDFVMLNQNWQNFNSKFKSYFFNIIDLVSPSNYKYLLPLILRELPYDKDLSLMGALRNCMTKIPADDPAWKTDTATINSLDKIIQNQIYRIKFLEEVRSRLSTQK